jgi:hypothetical protein
VVLIALAIGFVITAIVSKEPVAAYTAFLTGPLPRISFENGFAITNINRFGNWMEESTTLILLGLAVSIVFQGAPVQPGRRGADAPRRAGHCHHRRLTLPLPAPWHLILALVAAGTVGFSLGPDPRSAQSLSGRRRDRQHADAQRDRAPAFGPAALQLAARPDRRLYRHRAPSRNRRCCRWLIPGTRVS